MKAMASKPLSEKELMERINLYKEQSQQIIKPLLDYLKLHTPKIVLHQNGNIECQYSEEYWNLKRQIDEYLTVLQSQIFGEHNLSVHPT